ncbi:hypothetical protein [Ferrovum sp.]|uniref:hypothetical protein n=1 Tax=Ferrovum sp. TaxID=2609467 RepID=UPI0026070C1B|nr:hypothetical protein [Ferrovum sp.]
MIRTNKQQWTPGQQVRVGFLTLTVRAVVATPGDGRPDAYLLSNAAGTQLYRFVPHYGVEKIDLEEARAVLDAAKAAAVRQAAAVLARAQAEARAGAAIDALLGAC